MRIFTKYAKTLKVVANDAADFYRGDIALSIVAAAQQMPNGGSLSVTDIENYTAVTKNLW